MMKDEDLDVLEKCLHVSITLIAMKSPWSTQLVVSGSRSFNRLGEIMQIISEMGEEHTIEAHTDFLAFINASDSPTAELGYVDQTSEIVALTTVYPVDVITRVRAALDNAFDSGEGSFNVGAAVQGALHLWEEDRRWDRRTARLQQEECWHNWNEEVA